MTTKRLCILLVVGILGLVAYAWRHTEPWTSIAAPPEDAPTEEHAPRSSGAPEVPERTVRAGLVAQDPAELARIEAAARGGLTRGRSDPGEEAFSEAKGFLEKKQWDAAIEALERAVSAAPEHARAHCDLAFASLERGTPADLERALAAATRALELEPDFWQASYNLACVRARRGEAAEALRSLAKAVSIGSKSAVEAAREDSDLETLRNDPRFRELVPAR